MSPRTLLVAALVLSLLSAASGNACPLCYAPSLTLSEQVTREHAAVIAEWVSADLANDVQPATTAFRVQSQLHGDEVATGDIINVHVYRTAQVGDLFLITGTNIEPSNSRPTAAAKQQDGESTNGSNISSKHTDPTKHLLRWSEPIELSQVAAEYLKQLPPPHATTTERLTFALAHLEHPDDTISNDAYAEFAIAPFEDVASLAHLFPKAKIRDWLQSRQTLPTRTGLYGLMLGLCGDSEDEAFLAQKVFESTESFRLGIDGLIGGYLLLAGERGLSRVDQAKLASPESLISESLAAMNAVRFLWTDGRQYLDQHQPSQSKPITEERLRQSMRHVLGRPDLVEHAITHLARWADWSQIEPIYRLYGHADYDDRSIKLSIVRFLLTATRTKVDPPTTAQREQAHAYVEKLRDIDPKLVQRAERHLFLAAPQD